MRQNHKIGTTNNHMKQLTTASYKSQIIIWTAVRSLLEVKDNDECEYKFTTSFELSVAVRWCTQKVILLYDLYG